MSLANNKPLISVIVPIYQAENYLSRCVDSILSQLLVDIEVLLVNDGSTDRSGELCDEFARNDARVRVFHKSHSGVSDTRQMGLDNAIGEYVIHCDSDDWMEPDMLKKMYEKTKSNLVDMVVCDYWIDNAKKSNRYIQFPCGFNTKKPLEKQIKKLSFHVWNKLIRRTLFESYGISFPKGKTMAEDIYVVMSLLNYSIKVSYVPEPLYHYDCSINKNHVTSKYTKEDIDSNVEIINSLTCEINSSLHKKLQPIKRCVIIKAYEHGAMNKIEIANLFRDVQWQIILMSFVKTSLLPLAYVLISNRNKSVKK